MGRYWTVRALLKCLSSIKSSCMYTAITQKPETKKINMKLKP